MSDRLDLAEGGHPTKADDRTDSDGWERPTCDVRECDHLADWAYIGEGGDLYLCLVHASEETAGWQWIGER